MKFPPGEFLRRLVAQGRRRHAEATPRERTMLAGLAVVGALLSLSLGLRCLSAAVRERRTTALAWERREVLLACAAPVDEALRRMAAGAGARRTGADLLASLDAHARACGLIAEAGNPSVQKHGRTEVHKVRFVLRAAPMEKLLMFDERLREAGSGVCLDRFALESRDTDGGLTATYEITLCRIAE